MSVQDWAKWISEGQVTVPHLLLQHYKKLNLSDAEMMLMIHLHSYISQGIVFPSIRQLEARMTCSQAELSRMLKRLHKEGFIEIHSRLDENQRQIEQYSLQPLWEKLIRYLTINTEQSGPATTNKIVDGPRLEEEDLAGTVFQRFEEELGRPLTPMECETITAWLDDDQIKPEIILLALKEAVVANTRSLRYIDKILLEWQKKGLTTVQEVQSHLVTFREKQMTKLERPQAVPPVDFPFYNWLER